MSDIRDLQHRFHVDGRTFVIEVCHRCNPAAEPVPAFDTIIYACVSDALMDHEDDEPEKVVRAVFDQVHLLLPMASMSINGGNSSIACMSGSVSIGLLLRCASSPITDAEYGAALK